jgi:hypothetical protein
MEKHIIAQLIEGGATRITRFARLHAALVFGFPIAWGGMALTFGGQDVDRNASVMFMIAGPFFMAVPMLPVSFVIFILIGGLTRK